MSQCSRRSFHRDSGETEQASRWEVTGVGMGYPSWELRPFSLEPETGFDYLSQTIYEVHLLSPLPATAVFGPGGGRKEEKLKEGTEEKSNMFPFRCASLPHPHLPSPYQSIRRQSQQTTARNTLNVDLTVADLIAPTVPLTPHGTCTAEKPIQILVRNPFINHIQRANYDGSPFVS